MNPKEKTLRAKLSAAKSEARIRLRIYNAAERRLAKTVLTITELEKKLGKLELANP